MKAPFLQCLAGGLPYFMELQNGGPDGPERRRGEQRGGEAVPAAVASREAKRAGITRP